VINQAAVKGAVYGAIARTFEFPEREISDGTCAVDVPGWDSISNAFVILEIEDALGVKVPINELISAENVGMMIEVICASIPTQDPEQK
jgi:acyl carrier protein